MTTQRQLEALKLWRLAEGKSATPDGPLPVRREVEAAQIKFYESVAYGDLPTQLQPSLVRTLRKVFDDTPSQAEKFTRLWELQGIDKDEEWDTYGFSQANLEDLKNQGKTFITGGLPSLGPMEPYPQIGLTGSGKTGRASKVGEAFGINWEAIVNLRGRNVNIIRDGLEEMGRHAKNEGEIAVAKLLVDSNSFATASGQGLNGAHALTGNPDLYDPDDIATAIGELLEVSVEGTYPQYERFVILTAPANAPKIRRAVNATNFISQPGSGGGLQFTTQFDFGANIEVIGWRWLPRIWSSIGKGAVIVPIANNDDLPVLTRNRLAGFTEPSLWIKDSNARNVGGGVVNPETDGDFDSDAVMTKVRHVLGASSLWREAIGYTTGANT